MHLLLVEMSHEAYEEALEATNSFLEAVFGAKHKLSTIQLLDKERETGVYCSF